MYFNSIDFAIFLPIVFILYWFVFNKWLKFQNFFIVLASYVFYAWWDWRFLSLILFSTLVDYAVGLLMSKQDDTRKRKVLLSLSIFVNIGLLATFKYFNFFIDNLTTAFTFLGQDISFRYLNVILPVGISFYTFQTLSYTIDIYRKKLSPTPDFIAFAAFVSFFPQLVAGPIERATHLLPQFGKPRQFEYHKAVDGTRQILWGLFKKIVIADNCALYANDIFANYGDYAGSTLLLGAVFFAFQIYCDFSGYSDIAIGTSRLFGFDLIRNFNFPYFSRDIAEFWRRWHISLTTWFRDYVYIPLGGSRGGLKIQVRNTFIIFIVSGLWHGANWTFIAWGTINALFFLPLLLTKRNRQYTNAVAEGKILPNLTELLQIGATFFIVTLSWVFFRANDLSHAFSYLNALFSPSLLTLPVKDLWTINTGNHIIYLTVMLLVLIIVEWLQRAKQHGLELDSDKIVKPVRWSFYFLLIISCFIMNGVQQSFIYFQF